MKFIITWNWGKYKIWLIKHKRVKKRKKKWKYNQIFRNNEYNSGLKKQIIDWKKSKEKYQVTKNCLMEKWLIVENAIYKTGVIEK